MDYVVCIISAIILFGKWDVFAQGVKDGFVEQLNKKSK
jgi:hypothetical protein